MVQNLPKFFEQSPNFRSENIQQKNLLQQAQPQQYTITNSIKHGFFTENTDKASKSQNHKASDETELLFTMTVDYAYYNQKDLHSVK